MFRQHRYLILFLCGLFVSAAIEVCRPALSQSTTTPPEVATCLPPAPTAGINQFETLGSYTYPDSGLTYLYLLVTPPKPVSQPDSSSDGSESGGDNNNSAADDNTPLPSNPWRLVISYGASSGCQALTTPDNQSLSALLVPVARQLELQRYQKVVQQVGGIEAFKRALFSFENDPHHGSDLPEQVRIAPESAWALKQMGIKLPSNWVVGP
jgi:hypothetical protein